MYLFEQECSKDTLAKLLGPFYVESSLGIISSENSGFYIEVEKIALGSSFQDSTELS